MAMTSYTIFPYKEMHSKALYFIDTVIFVHFACQIDPGRAPRFPFERTPRPVPNCASDDNAGKARNEYHMKRDEFSNACYIDQSFL